MTATSIHVLISRACEYCSFCDGRDLADVIRVLRWGEYQNGTQHNHKSPHKREAERDWNTEEKRTTWWQSEWSDMVKMLEAARNKVFLGSPEGAVPATPCFQLLNSHSGLLTSRGARQCLGCFKPSACGILEQQRETDIVPLVRGTYLALSKPWFRYL